MAVFELHQEPSCIRFVVPTPVGIVSWRNEFAEALAHLVLGTNPERMTDDQRMLWSSTKEHYLG